MNPYLSGGTKDIEAASLVIEPLARTTTTTATMVPVAGGQIPTVENGGVAADLKSITWKLEAGRRLVRRHAVHRRRRGVLGRVLPARGDGLQSRCLLHRGRDGVEALDDFTVRIVFSVAKPFPYGPFVGSNTPIIQHEGAVRGLPGARAQDLHGAELRPHRHRPVQGRRVPGQRRDQSSPPTRTTASPASPAFATVTFKGGGDAASAARAVLETGEFDYAWNLQVEPEVLEQMVAAGKGEVVAGFGTNGRAARCQPDQQFDLGKDAARCTSTAPTRTRSCPIPSVRRALPWPSTARCGRLRDMAPTGQVTCNVAAGAAGLRVGRQRKLPGRQIIDEANRILDEAGWARGEDGVREKDGVRLSSSTRPPPTPCVRAPGADQADVAGRSGSRPSLRNIDAGVFFGGDPASPDTYQKFYADIEMYTNNFDGVPTRNSYMANWTCDGDSRARTTSGSAPTSPRACNRRSTTAWSNAWP